MVTRSEKVKIYFQTFKNRSQYIEYDSKFRIIY